MIYGKFVVLFETRYGQHNLTEHVGPVEACSPADYGVCGLNPTLA